MSGLDHSRQRGTEDAPDTLQVDAEGLLEGRVVEVDRTAPARDSGVRDRDVEPAEAPKRCRHEGVHRGGRPTSVSMTRACRPAASTSFRTASTSWPSGE